MKEVQFLKKLQAIWGDRFQINPDSYQGAHIKIHARCLEHSVDFTPLPTNLLSGHGCRECGKEKTRANRKGARAVLTQEEFLRRAKAVHGKRYGYDWAEYISAKQLMQIECAQHGIFQQNYSNHVLSGKGCPQCKYTQHKLVAACLGRRGGRTTGDKTKITLEECVRRAKAVHGDKYIYLRMEGIRGRNRIIAVCPKHGEFSQAYYDHTNAKAPQGCPRCSVQHSVGEMQLCAFVSRLIGLEVKHNNGLLDKHEIDIYVPSHGLAIEYCGEYYHSTASSNKHDKEIFARSRHKNKHDECAAKGLRLLTLWESEWKQHTHAVKQLVRTSLGKQRATIYARKCQVVSVDTAIAKQFFDRYHVQGGAGGGTHYGLQYGRHLVAVMRFALGANDRGAAAQKRVWTLGRYATRCSVPGGASRLFKAFLKAHNPTVVKSFSDDRLFAGGMYEKLGFALEEVLLPDYQVWSPKIGLRSKSFYQRRAIPARLAEHGFDPDSFDPISDPRTEREMVDLMKCGRLYDCGKKRWIWTNPELKC